jgi:hypothetical protein
MTILAISAWFMLVFCGLWSGGILFVAFARTVIWRQMSIDEYSVDFRRSLYRLGPMLSILGLITAISAGSFAYHSSGTARNLALAGVTGFVLIVVASIVVAAPIESQFRRVAEGRTPPRADFYRHIWRRFHVARTVLALLTYGSIVAAAIA